MMAEILASFHADFNINQQNIVGQISGQFIVLPR
jgi:hypothetical protein